MIKNRFKKQGENMLQLEYVRKSLRKESENVQFTGTEDFTFISKSGIYDSNRIVRKARYWC